MKVFKIILGAYIVFMIVIFMRCEKVTEISELVKSTDKIQITIYNDSMPDNYIEITDNGDIRKFKDYISNDDSPFYKCGFDGRIVFFIDEEIATGNKNSVAMEFSLEEGCTFIVYPYAGGVQSKKLTDEGIEYLSSLINRDAGL